MIYSYNADDDSYEICYSKEEQEAASMQEVVRVERILGQREERKEMNVNRFLIDLQGKKHKVILDKILTTKDGP